MLGFSLYLGDGGREGEKDRTRKRRRKGGGKEAEKERKEENEGGDRPFHSPADDV